MKNKNGFLLSEALFGFLIILLCVSLLLAMSKLVLKSQGMIVYEKIEREWFYTD